MSNLKNEISWLIEKRFKDWYSLTDKAEPNNREIQAFASELSEEIDFIYNNEFDHFRT